MIIKGILFILFLYLLVILQSSFFPFSLNLALISILVINIYESSKEKFGIIAAFFGGFFLDIYSSSFFGYNILILLGLSFIIKYVIKRNVQIPFTKV